MRVCDNCRGSKRVYSVTVLDAGWGLEETLEAVLLD